MQSADQTSIVEYALRRIVQVIELAAAGRPDEENREHRTEYDGKGQKKEYGVHAASARCTCCSTRTLL